MYSAQHWEHTPQMTTLPNHLPSSSPKLRELQLLSSFAAAESLEKAELDPILVAVFQQLLETGGKCRLSGTTLGLSI